MTEFSSRLGLRTPILLAPMAGVPSIDLSVGVARAGGMAALGALMMNPSQIHEWVAQARQAYGQSVLPLQINLWVPDAASAPDLGAEAALRGFLSNFGPPPKADAAQAPLEDFDAQCAALLQARPTAVSSIMGLYPEDFVRALKAAGILWLATVSTPSEARAAQAAGADVIVAQGAEAGGHRGSFDPAQGAKSAIGLFALLPQVVDAVRLPVIATGGIGDRRGVAAAFALGASAVQLGSALLRCPEANIAPAWRRALAQTNAEGTCLTRAFSGRYGRAVDNEYTRACAHPDAPPAAPYPRQRGLTAALRKQALANDDINTLQAWCGLGAILGRECPVQQVVEHLSAHAP